MHLRPHRTKPDLDNLVKFINDALNGVLWEDDAQISITVSHKTRTASYVGSTTVFLKQISEDKTNEEELINIIVENIKCEEQHGAP